MNLGNVALIDQWSGCSMTMHPTVLAGSLLATVLAVLICFLRRERYRGWRRASGTVVELIRREFTDSDNQLSVQYSPRVSFRTATGETVEFTSSVSSFPPPAIGDTIAVLYDPANAGKATIDRFMYRHLGEVVLFALGIIGVLIYWSQR